MQPHEFIWIYATTCVMIVLIEMVQAVTNLLKQTKEEDKEKKK